MCYILSNMHLSKYYLSLKTFLCHAVLSSFLVLPVLRVWNTPFSTYDFLLVLLRLDSEQLESGGHILEKTLWLISIYFMLLLVTDSLC